MNRSSGRDIMFGSLCFRTGCILIVAATKLMKAPESVVLVRTLDRCAQDRWARKLPSLPSPHKSRAIGQVGLTIGLFQQPQTKTAMRNAYI